MIVDDAGLKNIDDHWRSEMPQRFFETRQIPINSTCCQNLAVISHLSWLVLGKKIYMYMYIFIEELILPI